MANEPTTTSSAREAHAAGVASDKENARLKHAVEIDPKRTPGPAEKGSVTTRDDATDVGVHMLQGSPDEPQGPEDAFGPGPKRGDYSNRTGGVNSIQVEPNPDYDPEDPTSPASIAVPQTPRASQQGEVEGLKGGVDTTEADL